MMLTAQDLEPEFEQCPYCGVTCENPCDSLPSGPCERACNKVYGSDPTKPKGDQ